MAKGPLLDYLVVRDNDPDLFAQKVLEKLKAGYKCRHKMRTEQVFNHFDYLQNMVKRGPRPAKPAST